MALMAEKDFGAITVNEICERAMAHRTTFYNHYQDKYDLLDSGMLEMYEDLAEQFPPPEAVIAAYTPEEPPAHWVRLFEHIVENGAFYAVMLGGEGVEPFRKRLEQFLAKRSLSRLRAMSEKQSGPLAIPEEMVAHFNAGAIISALRWWAENSFSLPAAAMANHIMQLTGYWTMALFAELNPVPDS